MNKHINLSDEELENINGGAKLHLFMGGVDIALPGECYNLEGTKAKTRFVLKEAKSKAWIA